MMMGVSDVYLIPYAIALGASPSQVALITAVPPLVGAILQMQSAAMTQKIGSRLRLILWMVFFHAFAWMPIILIPWLCKDRFAAAPWALLAAVMVFASFGAFSVPAWQSLMSDYIPVKKRGKYFGWRNRFQGFLTVFVSMSAGFVLQFFGKDSLVGFTTIFIFAMLCRFYAWACLTRMIEPPRHATHDTYFSFIQFLRQIRTSNFTRFVLFVSLMSAAANLSGPLLPVFVLKDLGFNYASYMTLMTAAQLAGFLFMGVFGKYGDYFGNIRVIRVAGWGIAIMPCFWMFSQHLAYVVVVQFVAGAMWGGFNLLVLNFMMEAVSPEKRIRCISYFNVMNGTAVLIGAFVGSQLFHHLPPVFGYSYLTLFLLSSLLRMAVMTFVAPLVKEVRK